MKENVTGSEASEALEMWREVVRVTESTGDPIICAARLPLFLNIRQGPYRDSQKTTRQCLRLLRQLLRPERRLHVPEKRCELLVAMTSSAPATFGNLIPVIAAAEGRGISVSLLTVAAVKGSEWFKSKHRNACTVDDLIGFVPMVQRLRALATGYHRSGTLLHAVAQYAPQLLPRLTGRRVLLATDLALAEIYSIANRALLECWVPEHILSTGDYWPVDFSLMQVARSLSIPSLVLQHGMMAPFWWPFAADKLAVWGPLFFDEMFRIGAPHERLVLSGMPASDAAFKISHGRKVFAKTSEKFRILIIANTQSRARVPYIYSEFANLLRRAIAAFPDVQWQVKLHHRECHRFYEENGLSSFHNFTILPKATSLTSAFSQSEMALVIYSTAGLEAMQHGLPVAVPALGIDVEDNTWWPRYGGGVFTSDSENLIDFVHQLRDSAPVREEILSRQSKFLDRAFSNQGLAAEAVVDLVLRHMAKPKDQLAPLSNIAIDGTPQADSGVA